MSLGIRILAIFISLSMLIITFELIRREKLKERYSLLWVATAISMLILSLNTNSLNSIARFMGIIIPANALFFIGTLFLVLIIYYLTIVVSGMSDKNDRLAQEITLLKKKMEELEESSDRKR